MVEEKVAVQCYHCGDDCKTEDLKFDAKTFCCNGCLNVYQLLHQSELGDYYCLNEMPGQKIESFPKEKFAFLEEASVVQKLLSFRNKEQAQVTFFLPQMHCSSCLWLLEKLPDLNENIIYAQVNFQNKTINITFRIEKISLRQLAELLSHIGYEPLIDIYKDEKEQGKFKSRKSFLKLGVTGFALGNIMMLAFPDYLGLDPKANPSLDKAFNIANVLLSIPVVFYGAQEFFVNAWYSFRQKYLNIDAPIALAIAVTYLRSLYEVFSGIGAGYFDSMTGIVFFMLLGRTIQNRSYTTLKFNRDYKSYFPIALTRIKDGEEEMVNVESVEENDVLLIHHQEVIPTDCLLSKGKALVDYSFITGEEKSERVDKGELIYAGGKNMGEAIEVLTVKDFNQNSFTQLWNNKAFQKVQDDKESTVTIISKYFSVVVFIISLTSFLVWQFIQPEISWKAATAVLIIACPCALLLTASFTNGYLMERFAYFGFFLKNPLVIENLTKITHIAFDKTGTLTEADSKSVEVLEDALTKEDLEIVLYAMSQSLHPLSKAIVQHYNYTRKSLPSIGIKELPGLGIEVWHDDRHFKIGSRIFTTGHLQLNNEDTHVYISVDDELQAIYKFDSQLRPGTKEMMEQLSSEYRLSLISGDNAASKNYLSQLFPDEKALKYRMRPQHKLDYIQNLQQQNQKVMMIGDGLNDVGALQQSDVGIAVVKNAFSFSPSSDIIMEASNLIQLPTFIGWAKKGQQLIVIGFIYSLIFNIIGLGFAITGNLSPLVAAILMPLSSLGIILIAFAGVRKITKKV